MSPVADPRLATWMTYNSTESPLSKLSFAPGPCLSRLAPGLPCRQRRLWRGPENRCDQARGRRPEEQLHQGEHHLLPGECRQHMPPHRYKTLRGPVRGNRSLQRRPTCRGRHPRRRQRYNTWAHPAQEALSVASQPPRPSLRTRATSRRRASISHDVTPCVVSAERAS